MSSNCENCKMRVRAEQKPNSFFANVDDKIILTENDK